MRRTKQPRAIYSSLNDIAAEVLRITQAPAAPPDFSAAGAGELVQKSPEPGPVRPGSGNDAESTGTTAAPVNPVGWDLPGTPAKTGAAAAEPRKRFLVRRIEAKDLCPGCNNDLIWRVNRDGWMRLLPGSRHFMCDTCEARFLVFCGRTVRLA